MNKSDNAYKTIGEVVKILDLKTRSNQKKTLHTQLDFGKKNLNK